MSILGKAARRRGQGRWAPSLGAGPAVAALLLAALGWVCLSVAGGAMPLAAPIAHADSNGSLSLVQPADPEGPVGANIVARIQNAGNNVTFHLAYAPSDADCTATPLTPITALSANTTNNSGDRTFTFVWPADSGIGTFFLCAQIGDTTTILQSDKPYTVRSAQPPTISVAPMPEPTPTAGGSSFQVTPVASPTFTVGGDVAITGTNFVPGGTEINVWITGVQVAHNTKDLGDQLQITGGDKHTDTSGGFSVVVSLPVNRIDQQYIHVTTTDGTASLPPTLDVAQLIRINPAAPTPTVTVTATNTPGAASTPTPPEQGRGPGPLRILAIGGLGSFSVLLLVIGTMLLLSAGRRPN